MSCIIAKTVTYVSSLPVTYVTTLYKSAARGRLIVAPQAPRSIVFAAEPFRIRKVIALKNRFSHNSREPESFLETTGTAGGLRILLLIFLTK